MLKDPQADRVRRTDWLYCPYLDGIVDKVVRHIFPKSQTVNRKIVKYSYRERPQERKTLESAAKRDHAKAADELATPGREVVKSIRGESSFSTDTLAFIREAEDKSAALSIGSNQRRRHTTRGQTLMASLNRQYDEVIGMGGAV